MIYALQMLPLTTGKDPCHNQLVNISCMRIMDEGNMIIIRNKIFLSCKIMLHVLQKQYIVLEYVKLS